MTRQLIRWNEELILSTIQKLNSSGEDLRDIAAQKNHRKLYRAARAHLGSWRNSLRKAGISYREVEERIYGVRREQEKKQLLESLRKAHDSGVKLDMTSIVDDPDHKILYWSSKKFYSGRTAWEDCLTDAGLDPKSIVLQQKWTKQKIKKQMLQRNEKGLSCKRKDLPTELARAIDRNYGTYEEAIIALKLDPEKNVTSRRRTSSQLIEEIKSFDSEGINLSSSFIKRQKRNKGLRRTYFNSCRRFDGWENALLFAGINPKKYRVRHNWKREEIIPGIRDRYENGLSLNSGAISRKKNSDSDVPLYRAAVRRYGTWEAALTAAGFDYKDIFLQKESLSREEIINQIQELHEKGLALDVTSMCDQEDPFVRRLFTQSARKFSKGWAGAIAAAGLDYGEIRKKNPPLSFVDLKNRTLELSDSGRTLRPDLLLRDSCTKQICRAATKRFGGWYNFLEKIGIDPYRHGKRSDWKNGEGVIETLNEMYPSGLVTGVRGRDRNLAAAIYQYFDSVPDACRKANLVHSLRGNISEELLEKWDGAAGILYGHNSHFIRGHAIKVHYENISRGWPSMSTADLIQEGAKHFFSVLTKKPAKQDLREYIAGSVFKHLSKLNFYYVGEEKRQEEPPEPEFVPTRSLRSGEGFFTDFEEDQDRENDYFGRDYLEGYGAEDRYP